MKKYLMSIIILAFAAVLTAIGIKQGQHSEVLSKAINICLECIGIG